MRLLHRHPGRLLQLLRIELLESRMYSSMFAVLLLAVGKIFQIDIVAPQHPSQPSW